MATWLRLHDNSLINLDAVHEITFSESWIYFDNHVLKCENLKLGEFKAIREALIKKLEAKSLTEMLDPRDLQTT